MKNQIQIGNKSIEYVVVRSRRKTIGISIQSEQGLKVSAPYRVSDTYIHDVIQTKSSWILKKLKELEDAKPAERKFTPGEKLMVLGKEYYLCISEKVGIKTAQLDIGPSAVCLIIPEIKQLEQRTQIIRDALTKCLKKIAAEIVSERIEVYSKKLNVLPKKIVIKSQKTLWGSCTRDNAININWRIVMAPVEIVDYLVVHELAHIKVKNHSKTYWNLVESILPDHKERRKWLRENGSRLCI
ncbi:MAG: M48 family metallopeptidase [Clostridia bacterium]|nr:M48 family metallopeptidase [Clostridia bacterium]